jgi:putative ABC transport system permease protein
MARLGPLGGELGLDIRYAVRTLTRSPGFTAAAVLILAIGLTGTIAMFTLVNGVLLSPLPVRAEEQLVVGWRGLLDAGARRWPFSVADLDLLRRESRLLSGVAGVGYNDPWPMLVEDGAESTVVRAARVTGDFFNVLGVDPLVGRSLGIEDDREGAENVLVLTRQLWQTRFGGRPEVVGRRLIVGGLPFTIVGVMPGDVEHPRHVEAWMTVSGMQSTTSSRMARQAMSTELDMVARLRSGVTAAQAGDELRTLAAALDALGPAGAGGRGFVPQLQAYREFVIGDVRTALQILFAAVGLVLSIACANASSLFLVRGDARRTEFAVRAALGAGRGRILRQLLIEGVLLTALAGVLAVGASLVLVPAALAWVPDGLPRVEAVQIDRAVVAFSIGLAGIVAILATALPGMASARQEIVEELRGSGRASEPRGRLAWRRVMVAGQVALAVVALAGVGLVIGTLANLRTEARQLATDQLVMAPLVIPQAKYVDRAKWRELVTALTEAVQADGRVAAATPVNATPFTGTGWDVPIMTAEGQSDAEAKANPPLNLEEIHPGYFRTFEVPVIRGRAFTADDRADTPRVAIVSADVAARVWPGENPIGKRVKWGTPTSSAEWLTVVGISAPTRYRDLRTAWPTLYVPALQMLGGADQIAVRTSMPVGQVAELVSARLRLLDPDVQLMPPQPFAALLDEPLSRPRFYSALMTAFGLVGVVLAAIGLYGVIAASVRLRRREIGIRMALGAEARDVRRIVLVDGGWLVGTGVVCGLAASLLVTRTMRGLLYGVHPLDPTALMGAVAGIVVVSAVALAVPLRAAIRVDPADVLRAN